MRHQQSIDRSGNTLWIHSENTRSACTNLMGTCHICRVQAAQIIDAFFIRQSAPSVCDICMSRCWHMYCGTSARGNRNEKQKGVHSIRNYLTFYTLARSLLTIKYLNCKSFICRKEIGKLWTDIAHGCHTSCGWILLFFTIFNINNMQLRFITYKIYKIISCYRIGTINWNVGFYMKNSYNFWNY